MLSKRRYRKKGKRRSNVKNRFLRITLPQRGQVQQVGEHKSKQMVRLSKYKSYNKILP